MEEGKEENEFIISIAKDQNLESEAHLLWGLMKVLSTDSKHLLWGLMKVLSTKSIMFWLMKVLSLETYLLWGLMKVLSTESKHIYCEV